MVIGKDFIWIHMRKTGGDSVRYMFDIISRMVFYADPFISWEKHDTIEEKLKKFKKRGFPIEFLGEKQKRILNLRRLPAWLLSNAHQRKMEAKTPLDIDILRQGILPGKKDFPEAYPDKILTHFMCNRIDYWLRTEYLAEDFIKIMSNFVIINEPEQNLIRKIKANVTYYNKNIQDWFSNHDLEVIYKNNPLWAEKEKELYGTLLFNSWSI